METRCQVFTPMSIASQMLDLVDYRGNMYGKTIIENSCGEGGILCAVVARYIEGLQGEPLEYIRHGLEQDIVGYDIDKSCCHKTIVKLDSIAKQYGIDSVKWNISCQNTLKTESVNKFDFVVGNPPYISYRHMDMDDRNYLREHYDSCKIGAFDYCYAFIEHGLKSLKSGGKLVYLIPSSIFKNVHAFNLRELMKTHINRIFDYTTIKLFEKVLTSSAIIVCQKDCNCPTITYLDVASDKECTVSKESLGDKWLFAKGNDRMPQTRIVRFGDLFSASIVVATLLNEAFVLSNFEVNGNTVLCNDHLIESAVTRETASPRNLRNHKQERIIFPYYYIDTTLHRYSIDEFSKRFPLAVDYLMRYKEKLDNRDADKNAAWFEYGRSQALRRINQPKLLVSTIVTEKVEVYSLNAECIPYAGIYITSKGDTPLEVAKSILTSDDFKQYVLNIGIFANGHSVRITPKDIENYRFTL